MKEFLKIKNCKYLLSLTKAELKQLSTIVMSIVKMETVIVGRSIIVKLLNTLNW